MDVIRPVERNRVGRAGRCSSDDRIGCSVDAQAGLLVAERSRSRGVCSNQISKDDVSASIAGFIDSNYVTASAETAAADRDPGKANVPGNDVSDNCVERCFKYVYSACVVSDSI